MVSWLIWIVALEPEQLLGAVARIPATMSDSHEKGQFPDTRWSMVLRAKEGTEISSQRALAELCEIYWYPLFVRRGGKSKEAAEDLTQGLFESLISHASLENLDADRGRLRSFLIGAMKNFMADRWAKDTAQKRGGGATHIGIEFGDAEDRYLRELRDDLSPDRLFERRWAMTVLERVFQDLKQEYARRGKGELFEAIQDHLEWSPREARYAEIGAALGKSPAAVRQAVYNLRQRYRRLLEQEIGHTVASREDLREELDFLVGALRN